MRMKISKRDWKTIGRKKKFSNGMENTPMKKKLFKRNGNNRMRMKLSKRNGKQSDEKENFETGLETFG
jgi:hypothetical protein